MDEPTRRTAQHSAWSANAKQLTVSVSKKQKTRALRILDGIYKAWESLGHETRLADGALLDGDDSVTFSLSEVYRRVDKRKLGQDWPSWEYVETGNLALELTCRYFEGLRRKWCDGKRQKVEDVLDSFMEAIPKYMDGLRRERLDEECEKRQAQRAKGRLDAIQNEAKRYQELASELKQSTNDWIQARQIREYLAALKAWIDSGVVHPKDPEVFERWQQWAGWCADELCPLTLPGPRPGKTDIPTNVVLAELDVTSKTREQLASFTVCDTDELFELTRPQIEQLIPKYQWRFFEELTNVMLGLGYDTSNKDWNNRYG